MVVTWSSDSESFQHFIHIASLADVLYTSGVSYNTIIRMNDTTYFIRRHEAMKKYTKIICTSASEALVEYKKNILSLDTINITLLLCYSEQTITEPSTRDDFDQITYKTNMISQLCFEIKS